MYTYIYTHTPNTHTHTYTHTHTQTHTHTHTNADKVSFHQKIKTVFPSLALLDGQEPKSIKIAFNIPVPKSLPALQGNFLEIPAMADIVKQVPRLSVSVSQ
jgi:hypothetical protein